MKNETTGQTAVTFTSAFRHAVKQYDNLSASKKEDIRRTKARLQHRQEKAKEFASAS
ncbi:hypothetical protein [Thioclava sp. DLFJ4-1]|uniref:hypothetical protein n=1 Tax=Thioclava sp. DLFJ4-1 TaxID=1915313 RepID=UPI0014392777|nr:hypothetical protein [Thioclava sp. DLFJ4-1]